MGSDPEQSGDSNINIDVKILEALEKEIESILMKHSMKGDFEKLKKDYPFIAIEFMMFPEDKLDDATIEAILSQPEEATLKQAAEGGKKEIEQLKKLLDAL
jgi:hypothetical protein